MSDDEKIEMQCHVCGKKIMAPKRKAGHRFNCPKCDELLMVPFGDDPAPSMILKKRPSPEVRIKPVSQPVIVSQQNTSSIPARRWFIRRRSRYAIPLLVIALTGGIMWIAGAWVPLIAYPGILLFFGCLGALFSLKYRSFYHAITAAALSFIALVTFGYNDHYEHEWVDREFRYFDSCNRWTGNITHRKMLVFSDNVSAINNATLNLLIISNGPMTHGEPHGEWEIITLQPRLMSLKMWYWYGDEVTQGQWRLNNK